MLIEIVVMYGPENRHALRHTHYMRSRSKNETVSRLFFPPCDPIMRQRHPTLGHQIIAV